MYGRVRRRWGAWEGEEVGCMGGWDEEERGRVLR